MDFFLVEFASKILCCLLRFMDRNYFLGRHRPRTHTHKRKEKTSVVPTAVRDNKHSFASTSFVLLRFCASPMCQVPTGEPKWWERRRPLMQCRLKCKELVSLFVFIHFLCVLFYRQIIPRHSVVLYLLYFLFSDVSFFIGLTSEWKLNPKSHGRWVVQNIRICNLHLRC
jgi:hypothetical protein